MTDTFDAKFLQRLSFLENDLLSLDRSSFQLFHVKWQTLVNDLETAIQTMSLQEATITTVYTFASRVTHVVQMFLDIEILAEKLMGSLLDEASTPLDTVPIPHHVVTSAPPYLKPSYEWLLENIHNPYPSARIRDAIARKSGVVRKDVDNWFIDARRRIGWNDVRKAYFGNKRVEIVDAATRFYANDKRLSLSQGAEHALISIMKNAENLYSDKFGETILANKLAAVVEDLTLAKETEVNVERICQTQLKKDRDSYPSPDRSPGPLNPSLSDDAANATAIQLKPMAGRKRRDLSVEPIELDQNEEHRPKKRVRLENTSSSPEGHALSTGLPSPAPSFDKSLPDYDSAKQPSPPLTNSTSTSHQRCLSDLEVQGFSKRPRHLPVTFRPHNVSDPIPLPKNLLFDEASFDGWFQKNFDCPEADAISPGLSVELGNFSDFDSNTPDVESRSISPEFSKQPFEPPTSEVTDISLDLPWNGLDFWTDNFTLSSDNLRQSDSFVNFMGQESLVKPLSQDIANVQLPLPVSRSPDDFESFFGLANPSSVEPVVIPPDPASTETWNFPESSLHRDATVISGKHNIESSNSLASFNFGADSLSSNNTTLLPTITITQDKVRQEKEKEFREACQKAQRLALELENDLFA